MYYLNLLYFFGLLGLLIVLVYFVQRYRVKKRLEQIANMPFGKADRKTLLRIPHYSKLSASDRDKIERSIIRFVHTKKFVGVKMEVNDEMKVVIAFYACLLLLNIETENCYDNLKTIILYPSPVVMKGVRSKGGGIYTKEDFVIGGQSADDTVVLVWNEAKYEAYHLSHDNVIIHEFAHEIDYMNGEADGIPPLARSKYAEWTSVLFSDYQKLNDVLNHEREWGKYILLGAYAASNEAEFFAVITERFYESPQSLKRDFPELYEALKVFYKTDTAALAEKKIRGDQAPPKLS